MTKNLAFGVPPLKGTAATNISPFDDVMVAAQKALLIVGGMVQRYLGVRSVLLTPAGYVYDPSGQTIIAAQPMVISTDGLALQLDSAGNLVPGSGLMGKNNYEYLCYCMATEASYRRGFNTAFTHDDHTNASELNPEFITNFVLNQNMLLAMDFGYEKAMAEYEKARQGGADPRSLTKPINHAQTARSDPEFQDLLRTGERFTIKQLIKLFGDTVTLDGEFRPHMFNFRHCESNIAHPIPEVQAILDEERDRIHKLIESTGVTVQATRLVPIGKKYVVGTTDRDNLGLGDNGLMTFMQSGLVGKPLGHQYQPQRWVVIVGAVLGITVEELARYCAQRGYNVLVLLSAVEHLPGPFSKLSQIAPLRSNYPNAIRFQYKWPVSLMGPAPAKYNEIALSVLEKDMEVHAHSALPYQDNVLTTGAGDIKIINDWGTKW